MPREREVSTVGVSVLVLIFLEGSHRYRRIDRWPVEVVSSEWIHGIDRHERIVEDWSFDDRMNLSRILIRWARAVSSPDYRRGNRWLSLLRHAVEQEDGLVWWICSADRTVPVMHLSHSNRLSRPSLCSRIEMCGLRLTGEGGENRTSSVSQSSVKICFESREPADRTEPESSMVETLELDEFIESWLTLK